MVNIHNVISHDCKIKSKLESNVVIATGSQISFASQSSLLVELQRSLTAWELKQGVGERETEREVGRGEPREGFGSQAVAVAGFYLNSLLLLYFASMATQINPLVKISL